MKLTLVLNTMHIYTLVVFKNTFIMNPHFLVLKWSQNYSTNVTMIATIIQYNDKTFLSNTKMVLALSQAKH